MYASLVNDKLTFPDDSLGPNATLLQTKIQNNFSELSVYTAKTNSRLDKNFNIDIIGDVTKENTTSLTNQLKSQWINVAGSSGKSSHCCFVAGNFVFPFKIPFGSLSTN